MTISPAARRTLLISLLLALATLAVYWPVRHFEFVNFDDDLYVYENPQVQRGLTWDGLRWAFTSWDVAHWLPLVWISYMVDIEWHGLDAGGFHLTNLLLHVANAVLLFLVLQQLTGGSQSSVVSHQLSVGAEAKERSGAKFSPITGRRSLSPDPLWPSAWVAALFALHPLHVESVAWVTERKDVLSGLFWLLTLVAYGRYTASDQSSVVSDQLPKETGRGASRSRSTANRSLMPPRRRWYALTLLCFALGLMAKPMVVTLPFVLLLLDYWPLRRWPALSWSRLVREKLPLFALAVAASILTFVLAQHARATRDALPLDTRLATAVVAYASYLGKMVWPTGLACFYPHPGQWPVATVLAAGTVLAGLTALAVWRRRQTPALWVGWCWYLGTLVPVIGLVQVGDQAWADRFVYLPLIGLGLAVAWGLGEWVERQPAVKPVIALGGTVTVLACAVLTARQLPVWRNSETLMRQALAVTRNNWLAHNNLGNVLEENGQPAEAARHYRQGLEINPNDDMLHYNLGRALVALGQTTNAILSYQAALRLNPVEIKTLNSLGAALEISGDLTTAITCYRRALELAPNFLLAHSNLANALQQAGHPAEAIPHYERALQLYQADAPTDENVGVILDLPPLHYNLALCFERTGRPTEAIRQYQEALRLKPDYAKAHNNLGILLANQGRLTEAIDHYTAALRWLPDSPQVHFNLGNALIAQGRPTDALAQFERLFQLQPEFDRGRDQFALALQLAGRTTEAVAQYEQVLRVQPDALGALKNLAWLRATAADPALRDGAAAVRLAERAAALTGRRLPQYLDTLAAAYAAAGRWPEAVATAEQALALARAGNQAALVAEIDARLESYRAGQPWREPGRL